MMSRPEAIVMHELYRRPRGGTERELVARTQLAAATLRVALPKLRRRRLVEQRNDRWQLTGRGRMHARNMRLIPAGKGPS